MRSSEWRNWTVWRSRWLWGVMLGVGLGGAPVNAAETITLRFEDTQVTIATSEIEAFASSGAIEGDLGEFLQARPQLEEIAQELFTRQIDLGSSFREQLAQPSSGSIADFVVLQLDRLITSGTGQDTEAPVRSALLSALQTDDRFSLLELIQEFPETAVTVDLTGAERVYSDVSAFVDRIAPALQTVRSLLQDLVCECETAEGTTTTTPADGDNDADDAPAQEVDSPSPESDRSSLSRDRLQACSDAAVRATVASQSEAVRRP